MAANLEELRAAIMTQVSTDIIKALLQCHDKLTLEKENEHHYDLLHYTIQANHLEALYLLFGHGLFGGHQRPSHLPYLHLACMYGHASIVSVLLKYRPYDINHDISASSPIFQQLCHITMDHIHQTDACNTSEEEHHYIFKEEGDCSLRAVDVAAAFGHTKCVKLVLEFQLEGTSSLTEKAVQLNATRAVQLLLSLKEEDQSDIDKAFKMALTRKLARCVAVLLNYGAQPDAVLNGMNAYHIMYMYSSAFQVPHMPERHIGLADTTAVLLKHKLPVNTWLPAGSYPLHSLIHSLVQEKDFSPSKVPLQHIQALKLMLEAGADTKLDEVRKTTCVREHDQFSFGLIVGRDLYTSALNALFTALQQSDNWTGFDPAYIDYCCRLIVQHGGDPCNRDSYGDTALHDLMKCLAMQHAIGNMHLNLSAVINTLLQHGANPNKKSTNNIYPFCLYFMILFNLMGGNIAFDRWRTSNCCHQVIWMLTFMDHNKAIDACQQLIQSCQQEDAAMEHSNYNIPLSITTYLQEQIKGRVGHTKNLQLLCQLSIWNTINRSRDKLEALPVPKSIKRNIQSMFD